MSLFPWVSWVVYRLAFDPGSSRGGHKGDPRFGKKRKRVLGGEDVARTQSGFEKLVEDFCVPMSLGANSS